MNILWVKLSEEQDKESVTVLHAIILFMSGVEEVLQSMVEQVAKFHSRGPIMLGSHISTKCVWVDGR